MPMVEFAGDWDGLAREIDLWAVVGSSPTLWWRDDDAVAASPALHQLQQIARVPVALAVIPLAPDRPLDPSLAASLAKWPAAVVLQHGIAHRNRAGRDEKKSEFPVETAPGEIAAGLAAGAAALAGAFGPRFVPVLTPPWNRIDRSWPEKLPGLGYCGLSRFGEPPYAAPAPVAGLMEINTHVDLIDWRGSRGFAGETACLGRLIGHLSARRLGRTDRLLPTGLLTHHLVHDAATWRFLENLQDWLARRGELELFRSAAALWSSGLIAHD
jgi:hypothetical protein